MGDRRLPIGFTRLRIWLSSFFVLAMTLGLSSASFAQLLIVNEINSVAPDKFLNGGTLELDLDGEQAGDETFGRILGNGGPWFELVVIDEMPDLRGWVLDIWSEEVKVATLTLSQDILWTQLRAGSIVTVAVDVTEDVSYAPESGDWSINVRASESGSGTYISAISFPVSNSNWQVEIFDAQGERQVGPSGEGVAATGGVGSTEIYRLEEDPRAGIVATSLCYDDADTRSTFGLPNRWGTDRVQNFEALRNGTAPTSQCNRDEGISELAFDQSRIIEVEITMAAEDFDAMRRQARTIESVFGGNCGEAPPESPYTWFMADVTVDGTTVEDVGLRKKGFFGSPSTSKPALKIKFDEFGSNDRIYGLDRMTLNNSVQDPSLLDMCLAYDFYAAAGLVASRCSYAYVTINGEDLGIYMHVESIKGQFLAANYGSADGALYEGTTADFKENWLGVFESKNEAAEGAELDAVTAALLMPDDDDFLEALWAVIDQEKFMKSWVVGGMLGDWDGYWGGSNNFWVFKNPTTGKLEFFPWSNDDLFGRGSPFASLLDTSDAPVVFTSSALAYRLWEIESIRLAYQQLMTQLFDELWDEEALVATLQAREALISPIAGDLAEASAATQAWIQRREAVFLEAFADGPPEDRTAPQDKNCTIPAGNLDFSFENTYTDPLPASPEAPFQFFTVNDFSFTSWGTGTLGPESLSPALEVMVGADDLIGGDKLVLRAIAFHNAAAGQGLIFNLSVDEEEALDAVGSEVEVNDVISSFLLYLNATSTPPGIFPLGFVADTTLRLDQADLTNGGTVSGNFRSSLLTFNGHPVMDADADGWSDFDEKFCGADGEDYLVQPVDTDSDETCNFLDADDDGDGYSDEDELQAGTDPLDASVYPVPEPAAFLLSLTALLTLAGLRRLSLSRREARHIG